MFPLIPLPRGKRAINGWGADWLWEWVVSINSTSQREAGAREITVVMNA
ncbi:hypothetical protein FHK94_10630 [Cylindrospermopsis raciborskii CS-506_D]|uniref:Uncharacterized protein n=1 Tax=Cylindrospermopsis raciborskii CS-506_A TaxID=2585140 RepID=A0A838WK34_9CYAN|nr:hypothetical protein [Cylindrospermopsis raciborskii]MBA4445820.1 hypothetical protein [Cylindrospermopsis raciborskii CS-506_C]MBA4450060.1 hypothetical protein [Cylindrospermopsis raciborskii CS-506_D]MBA4456668.1 hypothetical protein [Cylindrospermopsis raciborskii CS-506_B]MBA4466031.1 hypothetical protein [Cylindrospermopsis raciborskii CS-506_A]